MTMVDVKNQPLESGVPISSKSEKGRVLKALRVMATGLGVTVRDIDTSVSFTNNYIRTDDGNEMKWKYFRLNIVKEGASKCPPGANCVGWMAVYKRFTYSGVLNSQFERMSWRHEGSNQWEVLNEDFKKKFSDHMAAANAEREAEKERQAKSKMQISHIID